MVKNQFVIVWNIKAKPDFKKTIKRIRNDSYQNAETVKKRDSKFSRWISRKSSTISFG